MGIILDVGIIIILLFFVFLGVKRGAVRAFLNFASIIAAGILSSWLGKLIAEFIYTTFVQKGVTDSIAKAMVDNANQIGTDSYITAVLQSIPEYIRQSLYAFGININDLQSSIGSQESITTWVNSAAGQIERAIAPVYMALISLATIIIIFVLLMIVRKFVVGALCSVFNLPILKQVNGLLGSILGLLEGVIIVFLICLLLHIMLPYWSDVPKIFSPDVIQSTAVFKHFYNCGIFSAFNANSASNVIQSGTQAVTVPIN